MRQQLLAKAEGLGLEFPKNISEANLKTLIEEKEAEVAKANSADKETISELQAEVKALREANQLPKEDTSLNRLVDAITGSSKRRDDAPFKGLGVEDLEDRQERRDKALTLIRVRVVPRDPSKVTHKGEIITVANDLLGDVQRYSVPFNLVTHVPYLIYKALAEKRVNIYDETIVNGEKSTGETTGGHRSIEAYSIAVLPKLTKEQLKELGKKQKLRSTDDEDRENAILELDEDKQEEAKDVLKEAGYNL